MSSQNELEQTGADVSIEGQIAASKGYIKPVVEVHKKPKGRSKLLPQSRNEIGFQYSHHQLHSEKKPKNARECEYVPNDRIFIKFSNQILK